MLVLLKGSLSYASNPSFNDEKEHYGIEMYLFYSSSLQIRLKIQLHPTEPIKIMQARILFPTEGIQNWYEILSGRRTRRTLIYIITFHSPSAICLYLWYLHTAERISDTVVN